MNNIEVLAKKLRREPFHMLGNNCFRKSLKFRTECRKIGINARIVFALVLTPCRRSHFPPWAVWFHTWAEIGGRRIELARPLDERNSVNTFDIEIKPLAAIRI